MKNFYLSVIALIGIMVFTISCSDYDDPKGGKDTDGDTVEITLSTDISSIPAFTKALSEDDEKTIKEIDILVFSVEGSDEKFAYRTHSTTTNLENQKDKEKYIKVNLIKSKDNSERFRIVLLANLRQELNEVIGDLDGEAHIGVLKEDLIRQIIIKQEGAWPVDSNKRLLPMWGGKLRSRPLSIKIPPPNLLAALLGCNAAWRVSN